MRFGSALWQRMPVVIQAVLTGLVVLLCGALGWSAITLGSLHLAASVSGAAGPLALLAGSIFLWGYWRYLGGAWWPRSTSLARHERLRANRLSGRAWVWALMTGTLATVSFIALLTVWGRIIRLQPWTVTGVSHYSFVTALCILAGAAAEAGVVEEAAFRGYMQVKMEKQYGPRVAILVVSLVFGLVHLANGNHELTWLLPYFVFGAILGVLAYRTNSIVPGALLHAAVDAVRFWLAWRGTPSSPHHLVWESGVDLNFWANLAIAGVFGSAAILAQRRLAALRLRSQQL
jgi:membrane protease YdiL (CAAX protease family)